MRSSASFAIDRFRVALLVSALASPNQVRTAERRWAVFTPRSIIFRVFLNIPIVISFFQIYYTSVLLRLKAVPVFAGGA